MIQCNAPVLSLFLKLYQQHEKKMIKSNESDNEHMNIKRSEYSYFLQWIDFLMDLLFAPKKLIWFAVQSYESIERGEKFYY